MKDDKKARYLWNNCVMMFNLADVLPRSFVGSIGEQSFLPLLSGKGNLPYFPVYKRPFFGLNFYFKNRGSLIQGVSKVSIHFKI